MRAPYIYLIILVLLFILVKAVELSLVRGEEKPIVHLSDIAIPKPPSRPIGTNVANKPVYAELEEKTGVDEEVTALLATPQPEREEPARIVIVIDDCGIRTSYEKEFIALSSNIVFAIIPEFPYAKRFHTTLTAKGYETIIHAPMEPFERKKMTEKYAIFKGMDAAAIYQTLRAFHTALPNAVGMNNHMGSRATSDVKTMEPVMRFCREKGLFFFDSLTSGVSVAYETALRFGVPSAQRDVFLDNDTSYNAIKRNFHILLRIAQRKGVAFAIGHYRVENTFRVLRDEIPKLSKYNIRLVRLSQEVRYAAARN